VSTVSLHLGLITASIQCTIGLCTIRHQLHALAEALPIAALFLQLQPALLWRHLQPCHPPRHYVLLAAAERQYEFSNIFRARIVHHGLVYGCGHRCNANWNKWYRVVEIRGRLAERRAWVRHGCQLIVSQQPATTEITGITQRCQQTITVTMQCLCNTPLWRRMTASWPASSVF
jgi:hypothetical protein